METIGFIVLRHVNSETTNKYWQLCISKIREFYPDSHIMLIDDNSNQSYITELSGIDNMTIIQSEFPGRGEFLPYYYYLKYKLFDCAVIIHDSVFIQQKMNFYTNSYQFIWYFPHQCSLPTHLPDIHKMLKKYNLAQKFDRSNCPGVFGCMTCISHDFLTSLNEKYNLSLLINDITCRDNRCAFERVLGCLIYFHGKTMGLGRRCMLGNICTYCEWGISFEDREKYKELPLLKVWTGR